MKKEKDKIALLMEAYRKTSAKRIAKEKRIEARWEAKQKARKLFEKETREKIIHVVRPVMKKLMAHVKAAGFSTRIEELNVPGDGAITEEYIIESREEKETNFYVAVAAHTELNELRVCYGYIIQDEKGDDYEKLYDLKDVNERLIRKQFITALKKLSTR